MAPFIQNWSPFRVFCLNLLWVIIAVPSFSFLGYVLIEKPFMRISDGLRRNQQKKVKESVVVPQTLPAMVPDK